MPIYSMKCPSCGWEGNVLAKVAARDNQQCMCGAKLDRLVDAPHVRVDQPADGSKAKHVGDADQLTADAFGVSKKDFDTEPRFAGLRNGGPGDLTAEFRKRRNPVGNSLGVGGIDTTPIRKG